ncbi:EamA family transporter [Paenibacillus sambharensis]|uniref:EamA family transporter n=1 Tax=Paenibacillus sambharensis TaxID=1803190 RepID=A0A2W1LMY5_9BACL|nr:EamA family transporter [Paenibacillus sambharensis]PZD96352.1 EamA family transporter [Paenibacillus sambharensis]
MIIVNYAVMCLIFGTTFLVIKIGVDAGVAPFFAGGLRFFTAGVILFLVMRIKERIPFKLLVSRDLLLVGIGMTFGTFGTLYWAEQHISSGMASVLSATGTLMIMLMQAFILKQKLKPAAIAGCIVGILGVLLLILPSLSVSLSSLWLFGCLVIIAGEIFYAGGTLYAQTARERTRTSPLAANSVQMMHGGLLLLLLSLCTEDVRWTAVVQPAFLASVSYLIVVGSIVGHSLYMYLVSKTNPVFPSTWLYVSPLIALTAGAALYQEKLTPVSLIGALTIITGTVLVNLEPLRSMVLRRWGTDKRKRKVEDFETAG